MTNQILHSSFYRLTPVADPRALANQILTWAQDLSGSLVVANQGVSGAVAGTPAAVAHFERALRQSDWLADVAHRIRFRHSACRTMPFGRMRVSVKPSLVTLGLPLTGPLPEPNQDDSTHLDPHAWRALMARGDCVVLDNRNHFEYRVGHFKGAIDPEVHHFRDFVAFVEARAPVWRAQARPVAMYCTGGIRCDMTAPWLRSLGLEVWQLDGGIFNYFETIPTAEEDWEGNCFVFDNRIAVNPRLEESPISAEAVYDPAFPEEQWRLDRARQLERSVQLDRAMQLDLAVDSGGVGTRFRPSPRATGHKRKAMSRKPVPTVPPIMNGLSASRVVMADGPWTTVGEFLTARFPAVSDWPRRLQNGRVLDAQFQAMNTDSPCYPGATLWYWREPPTELRVPFELDVLHQDDDLVAVDKPHFLPVTPGGRYLEETVLVRLQRLLGLQSLAPAHRLDLETAGVVLFTVVPEVRGHYQSLFRNQLVEKTYEAIALWPTDLSFPHVARCRIQERVGAQFMQMEIVPGEPNVETLIEVIRGRAGCLSHFRLTPRNGRKHQLRAQLSGLGMPIVGDRIYPDLKPQSGLAPDYSNPLQLLAREVAFIDPISGQRRCFISRRDLSGLSRLLPVDSE